MTLNNNKIEELYNFLNIYNTENESEEFCWQYFKIGFSIFNDSVQLSLFHGELSIDMTNNNAQLLFPEGNISHLKSIMEHDQFDINLQTPLDYNKEDTQVKRFFLMLIAIAMTIRNCLVDMKEFDKDTFCTKFRLQVMNVDKDLIDNIKFTADYFLNNS